MYLVLFNETNENEERSPAFKLYCKLCKHGIILVLNDVFIPAHYSTKRNVNEQCICVKQDQLVVFPYFVSGKHVPYHFCQLLVILGKYCFIWLFCALLYIFCCEHVNLFN